MTTHYTITLDDTGETYRCVDYRSVLAGSFSKKVMSREHVSEQDEASGCVLSCRVTPTSDLRIRVLGSMKKTVCRPAPTTGTPSLTPT